MPREQRRTQAHGGGEIYEIECRPAPNLFATGLLIRLDVASSDFPRYDINCNTGDRANPERRIAHDAMHHDALHPSHVLLPVLPSA